MKVGLILPGNIWFCPYVKIYTKILDKNNCEYETISWNRDNTEPITETTFDLNIVSIKRVSKFTPFFKYLSFVKSTLRRKNYDKVIVFGPQLGILLYPLLKKKYKNNFIFDYRDLSVEQLPMLKFVFKKLLAISSLNVISSLGFKKFLPKNNFIISHNFDANLLAQETIDSSVDVFGQESINVLTIGSIRDYDANLEVLKSLANKENIKLFFVGKGIVSDMLKEYAENNKIYNVFFHGFYEKYEEANFIKSATFINIYYPKIKSHSSAMSNRFYNALIYKRPMIVTNKSIQGDYVEEYKLGLSLDNCNNLYEEIINYKKEFDFSTFDNSSNDLLTVFKNDYHFFYDRVKNFLEN